MTLSSAERVVLAIAVVLRRRGENQSRLATETGLSMSQISRKQGHRTKWDLDELDKVAAYFGIRVSALIDGPEAAVAALPTSPTSGEQVTLDALSEEPEPTTASRQGDVEPAATETPEPSGEAELARREPEVVAAAVEPAAPVLQADHDRGADGNLLQETARPCTVCGVPTPYRAGGQPRHLGGFCRPGPGRQRMTAADTAAATTTASTEEAAAAREDAQPSRTTSRADRETIAMSELSGMITRRVEEAKVAHGGDVEAATQALIASAIPDFMLLWGKSRVGGRYDPTFYFTTLDLLKKPTQKQPDQIWEARPNWSNPDLKQRIRAGEGPFEVEALDANAAYLSAFKSHLPIGALKHDPSGEYDSKKAGIYLITPPEWEHTHLPNPMGNRKEPGRVWVTVSTLRLLLRVADSYKLCAPPVIHEAWVSGSTEGLLEKARKVLATARDEALARDDDVTVEYVKAMYSRFVSTCGESTSNREIQRADWMHIFRGQAFANHWLKAYRAHQAGLTVVTVKGTDELHVVGGWRRVFSEGRAITDMKRKHGYTLGA